MVGIPEATNLTHHRIRVDLAHVLAFVVLLHVVDVKVPSRVVVVGYADARIMGDHVVVDRLDRLGVRLHPSHLK